jgi:hypothetical protein
MARSGVVSARLTSYRRDKTDAASASPQRRCHIPHSTERLCIFRNILSSSKLAFYDYFAFARVSVLILWGSIRARHSQYNMLVALSIIYAIHFFDANCYRMRAFDRLINMPPPNLYARINLIGGKCYREIDRDLPINEIATPLAPASICIASTARFAIGQKWRAGFVPVRGLLYVATALIISIRIGVIKTDPRALLAIATVCINVRLIIVSFTY